MRERDISETKTLWNSSEIPTHTQVILQENKVTHFNCIFIPDTVSCRDAHITKLAKDTQNTVSRTLGTWVTCGTIREHPEQA